MKKNDPLFGLFFLFVLHVFPSSLFSFQPADTAQASFLQIYKQYLEKQAHFGLWEGEIVRQIHQGNRQNLNFKQTVTFGKDRWLLTEPPSVPFKDAASQWMEQHSGSGYAPPLLASLTGGVPSNSNPYGWQGHPVRHLEFVPSDLELDVLSELWTQPLQTDLELYRAVSSHWKITAEQLQKLLASMVSEGLVARKQISPQNILTIFLPFRTIYVEESALNRKNRVFIYKPGVRQKQVLSVLVREMENRNLSKKRKSFLREKLRRLLEF